MISICANCGQHVTKVSEVPEDRRYKHTSTNQGHCNLPPDSDGWGKSAVLTVVKNTAEWSEYRKNVWQDHKSRPEATSTTLTLTETIRLVLVNEEASGAQRQAEAVVAFLDDGGWLLRDG